MRITTAIVKAPSNAQQNTIVATRRCTKYLLINTAFLTDPAGKETKCEKAAARRQQKRRQDGRKRLIDEFSSPGKESLCADNRLLQANCTIAALRTEICKLSVEGTTDAVTSNRKVPDREWHDLVRRSKRRRKKMANSKRNAAQSEYINGEKMQRSPGTTTHHQSASLSSTSWPAQNNYASLNSPTLVSTVQQPSKPLSVASTISSTHILPAQTVQQYNTEQLAAMNMTRPPCQTNIHPVHHYPTYIRIDQPPERAPK